MIECSETGKYKMTIILKDSKQLQGYRYGQKDDAKVSNIAIGTIHPLGWVWNKTQNRTTQTFTKAELYETTMNTMHTIQYKEYYICSQGNVLV